MKIGLVFHYLSKLSRELFGLPLYWCTKLVPKKNNVWVFGEWHGTRYADNPRYLYEYLIKEHNEIRAVWLTKDDSIYVYLRESGSEVYKRYSFKGIYFSVIARFHFVTHSAGDTNPYFSGGSLLVNLTHGTPLKRIGRDANFERLGPLTKYFDILFSRFLPITRESDYIICADEMAVGRFKTAFPQVKKVIPLGYPRWEAFNEKEVIFELQELIKGFSIVVSYMPTLRFNNQKQFDPFSVDGFNEFVSMLEKNNVLLLVRPHPSMVLINENVNSRNIVFVKSSFIHDVSEIFKVTDLLITDYSSVMFDFKKLMKPIVLLAPDMHQYLNEDVGVYGDYVIDSPGEVVSNWFELMRVVKEFFNQPYSKNEARLVSFDISSKLYNYFK